MSTGPSHATHDAESAVPQPAPPVPALVPEAPVPLMVGHAEDRAEHDADAMADTALSRLRRLEDDTHAHGPGCDHSQVHRTAARVDGTPVVGYEGGALDSGTTSAIESRRGGGRALDADVRRRMETAFSRDFSSVRIHDDGQAAQLNTAVSARAFTTGKDIFFGSRQYAPGTPGGDRVLAHELAHTLQPDSGAHRLSVPTALSPTTRAAVARGVATTRVISRWDWWDKRKAKKADEAREAKDKKNNSAYKGVSGNAASVATEVGKPIGAGLAVGGVMLGTALAGVGSGGETLQGILAGDTGAGVMGGFNMAEEAEEFDDAGLGNLASRKKKAQGSGLGMATVGLAGAGVGTAMMKGAATTNVWDAAKLGGQATLGTAAGALGVAAGSAQVIQGAWRGGKAVMKLCRLVWGRAKTMLSKRGEGWKKAIVSAEKYKGAIAAMKVGLGVLGIAAGALLIVSNPIGWGIGLAAAIAGGVYAATKIAGKVKNAYDRTEAAKKVLADQPAFDNIGTGPTKKGSKTRLAYGQGAASDMFEEKNNEGFSQPDQDGLEYGTERQKTRQQVIAQANAIGREASANAVLADELRGALSQGDKEDVLQKLEFANASKHYDIGKGLPAEPERELHDAFLLLSSINVDPDEALSDSGQELIEKKLSKVEAM